MLWFAANSAFGSAVLVVADSAEGAVALAKRITGYNLNWKAVPFVVDDLDSQALAIDTIESWWCNYTDRAEGNDKISDAEFDAICACMKSAFAAVYSAWDY
jgi:hypothetical protein